MYLIHCADLHLDSRMETNLSPDAAKQRRDEILRTFARLSDHAEKNGVYGILIAGDLFDSERTTKRTVRFVLDTVRSHPNVYYFYLAGNHDSGNGIALREELPDNLFTFGENWTSFRFDDVVITGGERPNPETLDLKASDVNIVLLHGQVSSANASDPDLISLPAYKNRNIDYLALGHLHTYRELPLDTRGVACYSGCTEGRGFDECGPKGFVLLQIENGRLEKKFIPFACRTLHSLECDVSGCSSTSEIKERITALADRIPAQDFLKITLVGELESFVVLDLPYLEACLRERCFGSKVADRTKVLIHPEQYAHDVSLRGEFIRRVLDLKIDEKEKEALIACGLHVLKGEDPGL